jgi:hypothetical protein
MSRAVVEPILISWVRPGARGARAAPGASERAVSPRSYLFSTRACVEYTSHSLNYVASESDANQEVRGLGRSDSQDIDKWKTVAKQAKKSPNREEKRKWLRALHKVLVKELKAVVADDDADDVFKTRCRELLARIPDPHWGNETETSH